MSAVYHRVQAITDYGQRRKAIKSLSADNKKEYMRHQTNLRQRRYMSDPTNRAVAYMLNNAYRQSIPDPVKSREYTKKRTAYMRAYRARNK